MGFDGDELVNRVREWSAEHRVEAAAAERSADRWRKQLANETVRLSALALDVMERQLIVTLRTDGDRVHKGRIASVCVDFCVVVGNGRPGVLITWSAVRSLEIEGRSRSMISSYRSNSAPGMSLNEILSRLAEDRLRIRVTTIGNANANTGELMSVGDDVLALELDGEQRKTRFIPLSQIAEVALAG